MTGNIMLLHKGIAKQTAAVFTYKKQKVVSDILVEI